jgi:hypothetical protein
MYTDQLISDTASQINKFCSTGALGFFGGSDCLLMPLA